MEETDNKKQNLIFLAICFIVVFAIFGQTIFGDFVFDDRYIVDYRATLSDINSLHKVVTVPYWSRESGLYRPFTLLTYSFNYILLGSDPWGFHLINLILYALTGFLIFIIIKKLFKNNLLAYVTSGLFLVLPIHTEVVANIIGRAEILMLFFSLLVIWELTKEKINFWRTGLWFLFAIGSKETAIAMLPIILLVIYLIERGKNSKNVIRKYVPSFISVSVASLIYFGSRLLVLGKQYFLHVETSIVENPLKFVPAFSRIATAFKILFSIYIKKSILPFNLCSDYSYNQISIIKNFNGEAFFGLVLFILFILGFFIFLKRNPILSLGSAFFIFGILPVANIIFPTGTIAGERLMYLPSLGICLYLAWIFVSLLKNVKKRSSAKRVFWIFILLAIIYIVISIVRSNDWMTEKKLFVSAVKCSPKSVLSRSNLGATYYLEGDLADAKKELLLAQQIYDGYPKGINNLGLVYWKEGNKNKAKELFLKALSFKFPYYGAYENLAIMALEDKNYDEARQYLEKFFDGNQQAVEDYINSYKNSN